MKKIIIPIALLATLFIAGCNKCYECTTATDKQTYCKNTPAYDVLKSGGSLTDNNGQTYSCSLK